MVSGTANSDLILELEEELTRERRAADVYMAERDAAYAQRDRVLQILSRIYGLLYPHPITVEGKTYVFRPETAGEDMQRLCDAIRKIPDQLEELKKCQEQPVLPL